MNKKKCITCKKILEISQFYSTHNNKHMFSECKKCANIRNKQWTAKHKKELAIYHKNKHRETKIRVINKYGGKCACCKENKIEFLCLDHINKDGGKERKTGMKGSKFYRYLDSLPRIKTIRVLCSNCNTSLGLYGYCPHNKL